MTTIPFRSQPPNGQHVPQLPEAALVAEDETPLLEVRLPHCRGISSSRRACQQRQQCSEGCGQVRMILSLLSTFPIQALQDGLCEKRRSFGPTTACKKARRGKTGREANASSKTTSHQDREREGGTTSEDEGEVREEVRHPREDPLHGA